CLLWISEVCFCSDYKTVPSAFATGDVTWFAAARWNRICDSSTEMEFVHSVRQIIYSADNLAEKGGCLAR
ncbi:hypothetical protein MKX03_011609, partial [Papaver bracteatum]